MICVIQLCVHIRTMPFSTLTKNLLEFIGQAVSALIAFTGLVLNHLNVSLDLARSGGQVFEVERLTRQIETVKAVLSVITIGSIVVASILQTIKTALKAYEKRAKIARNLAAAKKVAEKGANRVRTAGRTTMIKINKRRPTPSSIPRPTSGVELAELQAQECVNIVRALHAIVPSLKLPRGKADDDALLARLQR